MSNKFGGVVALTQQQYEALKEDGSITIGQTTITFDEYTLYVITDSPEIYSKDQMDAILASLNLQGLSNRVSALENTKANRSELPEIIDIGGD